MGYEDEFRICVMLFITDMCTQARKHEKHEEEDTTLMFEVNLIPGDRPSCLAVSVFVCV